MQHVSRGHLQTQICCLDEIDRKSTVACSPLHPAVYIAPVNNCSRLAKIKRSTSFEEIPFLLFKGGEGTKCDQTPQTFNYTARPSYIHALSSILESSSLSTCSRSNMGRFAWGRVESRHVYRA